MSSQTIKEALQRASFCLQEAGIEHPRKEAEYLLAKILKTDRLQLFLRQDQQLSPELEESFREALNRRCRHEPAAYIAGEKYFYGCRFKVTRDVLIPRPETELIVDCALTWADRFAENQLKSLSCADLGTGSGALIVTLALLLPGSQLWAVDLSNAALRIARLNAVEHGVLDRINFLQGSFFDAFDHFRHKPKFNLIVSNPPYLDWSELEKLPRGVKHYEPLTALDGGFDGLQGYRLILERLKEFASSPALLLMEIGAGQKEAVEDLCSESGLFKAINWRYDLNNWPRVMEGVIS